MGKMEMEDIGLKLRQDITLTDRVNNSVESAYDQIRRQSAGSTGKNRKFSKRPKKWFVLVAAAVALMASSVIVMAAMGFFQKEKKLEAQELTYSFELDYDLQPGTFDVSVDYLPEGYVKQEEGKYCTEDNWGHGFTIMPIYNTAELDRIGKEIKMYRVDTVEPMTLSGLEADVVTFQEAEKYECPTEIFLFSPEDGYVVQIWGDYSVPKDELVKVADSLTVTRTGDAKFDTEEEAAERQAQEEQMREEQEAMDARNAQGVSTDQIVPLGQKGTYSEAEFGGGDISFTVKKAEFMDAWTDFETENFYDYSRIKPWLQEDGTLKPYLRQHYQQSGTQEETAEQCFLKVEVQAEKTLGADAEDWAANTALDACVRRLLPEEGGVYGWPEDDYRPVESEHNEMQLDGRCIYMDQPVNVEGEARDHQFFYREMKDGETIDYTLVFVVDKDIAKSPLVLDFNAFCNPGTAEGTFFAIK